MATFRDVSDRLCMTAAELGEHLGVPAQSVRQYRLAADHANHRKPPDGWERILAKLARRRAAELLKLADQLES